MTPGASRLVDLYSAQGTKRLAKLFGNDDTDTCESSSDAGSWGTDSCSDGPIDSDGPLQASDGFMDKPGGMVASDEADLSGTSVGKIVLRNHLQNNLLRLDATLPRTLRCLGYLLSLENLLRVRNLSAQILQEWNDLLDVDIQQACTWLTAKLRKLYTLPKHVLSCLRETDGQNGEAAERLRNPGSLIGGSNSIFHTDFQAKLMLFLHSQKRTSEKSLQVCTLGRFGTQGNCGEARGGHWNIYTVGTVSPLL